MAGLINTQRQAEEAPDNSQPEAQAAPAQPGQGGQDISADSVRSQMQIPPELQSAYERVVTAGKKILYSEQMAPDIQQMLQGPGDMGQKLGHGITALMALLVSKANGTMPPQIIIPAAIELLADAADMLKKAGSKITPQDTAEGMAVLVQTILENAGVSPEDLPQLVAQQGGGQAQGPAEEAAESPQEQAAEGPEGEAAEDEQAETPDEEAAPDEEDDSKSPQVAADGRPAFPKKGK